MNNTPNLHMDNTATLNIIYFHNPPTLPYICDTGKSRLKLELKSANALIYYDLDFQSQSPSFVSRNV